MDPFILFLGQQNINNGGCWTAEKSCMLCEQILENRRKEQELQIIILFLPTLFLHHFSSYYYKIFSIILFLLIAESKNPKISGVLSIGKFFLCPDNLWIEARKIFV